MNLSHFENKTRQSNWVADGILPCASPDEGHAQSRAEVHDGARKQAEYQAELRRHRRLEERAKRQNRRARLRFAVSTDVRNRAIQAFFAMLRVAG